MREATGLSWPSPILIAYDKSLSYAYILHLKAMHDTYLVTFRATDNEGECIDMMLGSQEGVPKKVTVRKRDVAGDSACTRNRHQDKHGKRRGRRSGSLCPNPVIFQFQIVFVSPPTGIISEIIHSLTS